MIGSPDNLFFKIGKRGTAKFFSPQKLFKITVTELYQDMLQSKESGGLSEVQNKYGKYFFSDTVLRY